MPKAVKPWLVLFALLGSGGVDLRAQNHLDDPPKPLAPRKPPTRPEAHRREALRLYGLAVRCERENRLLEATRTLEEAVKLAPEAAPLHRALIPLYLALDRSQDVLSACRKTLDGDPDDFKTWHLYARQLRSQGRPREAREALERAFRSPAVKDHPESLALVAFDLGSMAADAQDYDQALAAFAEVARAAPSLDEPEEAQARAAEAYVRTCLKAKRYDQALAFCKSLEETARRSPDPVRYGRLNYYMAQVCLARQDPR